MKIAVVVLHYKNLSDTLECLDSLSLQDYPSYDVVLIDNNSGDAELEGALLKYSNLFFLKSPTNLGFAGGNNLGIRLALEKGADAVLLLNNDTTIAPNLLSAFVGAAAQHPQAGAFGAKIYYYDEPTILWHAGGDVNPLTKRCFHYGCNDSDLEGKWDQVRQIPYACGCALFVKKETIEAVGLMAPEFFLLWEEIDWCWRIRKAGYECLFIPEAKVWHKISRSFEGGNRGPLWQYYYFRNRLLFLKRHYSKKERYRFYLFNLCKELSQIFWALLHPKSSQETVQRNLFALKGIWHYFLKR
jgi:GT2 family glycosyltransferase